MIYGPKIKVDMHGSKESLEIHGPKINVTSLYNHLEFPGFDILGPKIDVPSLGIHGLNSIINSSKLSLTEKNSKLMK